MGAIGGGHRPVGAARGRAADRRASDRDQRAHGQRAQRVERIVCRRARRRTRAQRRDLEVEAQALEVVDGSVIRRPCSSTRERPQRARDAQPGGVLAAAQPARDLLVVELLHDPQLERAPLLGRQRAHRGGSARRQRARGDALVDRARSPRTRRRRAAARAARARRSRCGCACGTGAAGCARCRTATARRSRRPCPGSAASECQACANVSAVRSSAARLGARLALRTTTRIQTA